MVEMMNQITPTENWLILAMFIYMNKGSNREAYAYKDMSGMFVGVARMFFHQSLTVYTVISDPFNGLNEHTRVQNPYISNSTAETYGNIRFKVGLNYNFNTTQSKYKGQGAGEEEKNRL